MLHRTLVTLLMAVLAAAVPALAQDAKPPECKDQPGGCQDAPKPEAAPEAKQDAPKPAPPPEAKPPETAQDKKKGHGPLGLPAADVLKEKLGLNDDQAAKVNDLYNSYKKQVREAQKKFKEAADKKAARAEIEPLRTEIAGKLKDLCTEEQKPKLDELLAPPKKKKKDVE